MHIGYRRHNDETERHGTTRSARLSSSFAVASELKVSFGPRDEPKSVQSMSLIENGNISETSRFGAIGRAENDAD